MALWTDLIDPATLTGYAREAQADYERRQGTLARWLPNRFVADIVARFIRGRTGLVDIAKFRAYDAELQPGRRQPGKRVTLELPALGQWLPVTEYEQLRARQGNNVTDAETLRTILQTTRTVARATSDAMEWLRGVVINTGKATINDGEFYSDDDFGRPGSHTFVAPALWSVAGTDRLTQLQTWEDLYKDVGGQPVGAWVGSQQALRALASGTQFQTVLAGGGSRLGTIDEVRAVIASHELAPFITYDRKVSIDGVPTRVLPANRVFALPAPVDPDDWEATELGASFWGRTLSSTAADWEIADEEQPGLVTGVWQNEKPPMGLEIMADAIGEPVLGNAELSMSVQVLP